jgi:PKHD-type hydroxylase
MFLELDASAYDRLGAIVAEGAEPLEWQNDAVSALRLVPEWLSCEERLHLIELRDRMSWIPGRLRNGESGARVSDNAWIEFSETSAWLYRKLASTFVAMNRHFQFDLQGLNEEPQLARYSAGGTLDWHLDLGTGSTSVRKLALVALVDRSSDCTGGELEFATVMNRVARLRVGDAVVFPPFIAHRVTRLAAGSRLSLVAWACGPAFK